MNLLTKVRQAYRFVKAHGHHLPMAFEALFSLPCTLVMWQGTLKNSDQQATVLYVGRRRNYVYLEQLIFTEHRQLEVRQSTVLSCRKHMDRMAEAADVVLVDLGWPYDGLLKGKDQYLETPDWLSMAVDLADSWEAVLQNFRKSTRDNELRLIRRNAYRYATTNSRAAIEEFYDTMYLPFVTSRHADASVVESRNHVVARGMQGQLLQVIHDNKTVAAGVVYPKEDVLYFLWLGLPADSMDSRPEAAISALYFFAIRYAFDKQNRAIDLAGTRAFLNDGVFKFKRKWGALVEDTFSPSSILVRPSNTGSAAAFCRSFPVLVRVEQGLEALFVHTDGPADEKVFSRLRKQYGCEGIARMTVICISDRNETRLLPSPDDECQHLLINSRQDCFAQQYVRRPADGGALSTSPGTSPETGAG